MTSIIIIHIRRAKVSKTPIKKKIRRILTNISMKSWNTSIRRVTILTTLRKKMGEAGKGDPKHEAFIPYCSRFFSFCGCFAGGDPGFA